MNLNDNPTVEQLRELVRPCDDSGAHHALWVTTSGQVKLSEVPDDQTADEFEQSHPDLQLRLETFQAGNEYVGPDAADDDEWMTELFHALVREWPVAAKREILSVDQL